MRDSGDRRLPDDLERFEFEGEESFCLALEIAELADDVAMEIRRDRPWVASQLGTASLSILNNTAEGRGEFSRGEKAKFYRYARRSASETAGMVVFLARKLLIPLDIEIRLRRLLLHSIKLLTRRILHVSAGSRHSRNPASGRGGRSGARGARLRPAEAGEPRKKAAPSSQQSPRKQTRPGR